MKNIKKFTKGVSRFATGAGVGLVVSNVVRATTPCCSGILAKGAIALGTFVLANMATDRATEWFDDETEKIEEELEEIDNHIQVDE